ncbi:unnamed protein product [Mytilus edulis]|uniref:CCHC-type domain-containing protein n=1 Tax=Mytilus edulis TaxID=6550 RepID=A0A8S3TTE8_MYTED|nr:unnamed protein product [Mytilus edulis]
MDTQKIKKELREMKQKIEENELYLAEVEPRAKFHDLDTGPPSSPVHKMDYAGAIPRRRLIPEMDEFKRVTFSPKLDRVEKYSSTPKRLPSPHSPIKKAPIPRYESTYLGDQYDTPEVTRAWDAFVTVRDKNKGSSQTRLSSPPRPLPRAFKPADDKVTHSGKLPNKPIVTPICFDGKQMEIRDWLSQFENCRAINLWTDDQCVKILPTFLRAQALQLYNDMTLIEKGDYGSLIKFLIQKFDPIQDPGVYLSQLHSMTQSSYKSLLQLSSAVFRLVCKAYPSIDSDSKQKMSIQYFIDALSDSEVQKQVRRLSPKTLAEAVDLALREESYVTLEKKRPKTQSLSEVEPSDQFSVFSKQLEELRECVAKLSVGKFSADRVEEAAVAPAPIQIPAGNTQNFGNRGGYGNRYRGRGRGNYGRGAQRGGYNSPGQYMGQNQNGGYYSYPDQNTGFTGQSQGNAPTFYGGRDNFSQRGCWNCGDLNHFKRDCPNGSLNGYW